jgi:hypothetical protein
LDEELPKDCGKPFLRAPYTFLETALGEESKSRKEREILSPTYNQRLP